MKYFIISVILISSQLFPQDQKNDSADLFSKTELEKHLSFLGSDSLKGRGTGTEGEMQAALYIKDELEKTGLKPPAKNSFYQEIPLLGSTPLENSRLTFYKNEKSHEYKLNEDYLMYYTGEQTFIPNPIPLVFAGYGIIAPEFDYNDYQSVDVEGKIAVMISGEPVSNDPDYFNGERETIYSLTEAKQRLAISRGASGCIIIPYRDGWTDSDWEFFKKQFAFENVMLPYNVTNNLSLLFNPAKAGELFSGTGITLEEIYMMHNQNNIKSFPLDAELSFSGSFREREFISRNVIGIIEGNDPELKDSYLIISSHFDHLGVGPAVSGDSIYNGVFDNAIGAAAVLELAKAFKAAENKLKRSVIFLFLTGEEKGLIGSTFYVDHPAVPLYKTIADINVDGIAVFDEFKSIVGVGADYSELGNLLKETAEDLNLTISSIPQQFQQSESFYRSDQIIFAMAGIPSILTMDGIDYKHLSEEEGLKKFLNYSRNIYHTPFDDLNQEINLDASIQHIEFLYLMSYKLLTGYEIPEWKEDSPFLNARLRSIAEKR
ncbi:MAG: M28 family peptidase [Ignavibacteria bacterium]